MNRKRIVAPSLLSANFLNLEKEIEMLNNSKAEWIHCDIMDGHFVPNITFGFTLLKAIRKATSKIIDVHLMIDNADKYINAFVESGADIISVHYENNYHLHKILQNIRELGAKAAVALNPHTPICVLQNIIASCDMVLLMSVNPGFGGQKFIPLTYEKIADLRELKEKYNPDCLIQVDGGVNSSNAKQLFELGVNVLVAGNSVFLSNNPTSEIEKILHSL